MTPSPTPNADLGELVRRLKITADGNPLSRYCDHRAADVAVIRQAAEMLAAQQREIEGLRAERDFLLTCGVAELGARNPNVSHYVEHWEGRTDKAEAEVAALRGKLDRAAEALAVIRAEADRPTVQLVHLKRAVVVAVKKAAVHAELTQEGGNV